MRRLPSLPSRRVIATLERAGFAIVRIKGMHHFLQHRTEPARQTIVSHYAKDLPPGTLKAILKQADLTRRSFLTCCRRGVWAWIAHLHPAKRPRSLEKRRNQQKRPNPHLHGLSFV